MTRTRPSRRARLVALLLPLAAVALPAASADAQSCLGFSSFRTHPVRLGGSVGSGDNATSLGLDLAFGQAQGAFGGVGLGLVDVDGTDENATQIAGSIGYQVPLGTTGRGGPQVCPVGSIGYTIGPDVGDVDVRTLSLQGGFALGAPVTLTPTVNLTPFGAISILHLRQSISDGSLDLDDTETGGILDIGAGLIFADRFTIRPSINIPIGFDNSDTGFSLALGLSFGGPR